MSKTLDTLAQILFNVEKVPMSKVAPGFTTNSQDEFAIVGYPAGQKIILNTCSEAYKLLNNAEILLPIVEYLEGMFGPDNIKIRLFAEDNARFHVDLVPARVKPIVGDLLPMFRYKNSYDGEFPAELSGATYRTVCANGAAIFHKGSALNYKFKHNDRNILEFAGMDEKIEMFLKGFNTLESKIEVLRKKKIKSDDLIETIELIAAGDILYPKKGIAMAIDRARSEASTTKEGLNFWLAYNGLNYVLNHDRKMKMEENRRHQIDAKIFNHALTLAAK